MLLLDGKAAAAWKKRFPDFTPDEVLSFQGLHCYRQHKKWMINFYALDLLQKLRNRVGPIRITSGYRSPSENAKAGGADFSSHVQGNAFDVVPLSCSIDELCAAALEVGFVYVAPNKAKGYVHMDWRPTLEHLFFKDNDMALSKSPVKSLSMWGSIGAFTSLLSLLSQISDLIARIPPELLKDTHLWYTAVLALVSTTVALIGRWKAQLPLWPIKKKGLLE